MTTLSQGGLGKLTPAVVPSRLFTAAQEVKHWDPWSDFEASLGSAVEHHFTVALPYVPEGCWRAGELVREQWMRRWFTWRDLRVLWAFQEKLSRDPDCVSALQRGHPNVVPAVRKTYSVYFKARIWRCVSVYVMHRGQGKSLPTSKADKRLPFCMLMPRGVLICLIRFLTLCVYQSSLICISNAYLIFMPCFASDILQCWSILADMKHLIPSFLVCGRINCSILPMPRISAGREPFLLHVRPRAGPLIAS